LVDRKGDIPLLINHILKRHSSTRAEPVNKISEDAMEILLNHDYPGNVRELENIIEHALIICQGNMIERKHLPLNLQEKRVHEIQGVGGIDLGEEIGASENDMIRAMLKKYGWNRGKTAQALNINRTTLWRKMKKYNISLS
jgi:transcriptional regulator with PAS, ATPase and Fis domain